MFRTHDPTHMLPSINMYVYVYVYVYPCRYIRMYA